MKLFFSALLNKDISYYGSDKNEYDPLLYDYMYVCMSVSS